MNTGSLASAWSPDHGEQNHDSVDNESYVALELAHTDGVGRVDSNRNWLNTRWRS